LKEKPPAWIPLPDVVKSRLQEFAAAAAEEAGAHLIDLIVRGDARRKVIEVFVDAAGGVTTDLCSAVSRSFADRIDAAGVVEGSYRLEVSSPGIDRPLQFWWQYTKHVGRTLEFRRAGGGETVRGELVAAHETAIVVRTAAHQDVTFAFNEIAEAHIQAPW
jgi:ribosome maturation factor RimP